jgi:hypothetical protein
MSDQAIINHASELTVGIHQFEGDPAVHTEAAAVRTVVHIAAVASTAARNLAAGFANRIARRHSLVEAASSRPGTHPGVVVAGRSHPDRSSDHKAGPAAGSRRPGCNRNQTCLWS